MNKTIRMIQKWTPYAVMVPVVALSACKDDDDNTAPPKPDVVTTNGVIHAIDRVLLPPTQ